MAAQHGKNCQVLLGGTDLSHYFTSSALDIAVDTADSSTFRGPLVAGVTGTNSGWKTHAVGQVSGGVGVEGLFDATLVTALKAILGSATDDVLTIGEYGLDTVGNLCTLLAVQSEKLSHTAPVGGLVAAGWDVKANGVVGIGRVLHPLVAVTADGTGTSVDGAAQTTTGAVAQLHVTSVSASDTLLVTIEDSANNSTWATIGTFTLASAVTAQRITIAGTVRRYTRCVWDVTGTGVSIPFAVALART